MRFAIRLLLYGIALALALAAFVPSLCTSSNVAVPAMTTAPHQPLLTTDWGGLEQLPPRPKLHFLFPVTTMSPLGCKSILSALVHGYEPILLNWRAEQTGHSAQLLKVQGVRDYLTNNVTEATDLILMGDAFDVWFQQPPEVLIDRFMEDPNRVLIGADKKCWPTPRDRAECADVPDSPLPKAAYGDATDSAGILPETEELHRFSRPRWANSGTIMARASLLKTAYDELLEVAQDNDPGMGDQPLFISLYHKAPNDPLALDMTSTLFQVMTFSQDDVVWVASAHGLPEHGSAADLAAPGRAPPRGLSANPPLARNVVSGSLPVALHFNGHEKMLMTASSSAEPSWWAKMWFVSGGPGSADERAEVLRWVRQRARAGGATVAETGEWLSWEALGCERDDVYGEFIRS